MLSKLCDVKGEENTQRWEGTTVPLASSQSFCTPKSTHQHTFFVVRNRDALKLLYLSFLRQECRKTRGGIWEGKFNS